MSIEPLPEFLDAWAKARKGGGSKGNQGVKGTRGSGTAQTNNLLSNKPDYLVGGPSFGVGAVIEAAFKPVFTQTELERLCEALRAVPADLGYQEWVTVGMALRELAWETDHGEDVGFEIWNSWSESAKVKYPGRGALESKWLTFGRNYNGVRVTIASVYELAKNHGWVDSKVLRYGSSTVLNNNVNGSTGNIHALPLNLTTNPIRWLDIDKFGNPKPTCANTRVALQYMGVQCKYDLFHDRQYVGGRVIEQWAGELADNAVLALRGMIRGQWTIDPPTQTVLDALVIECLEHAFDPVEEYLDHLRWDGVNRLNSWLGDFLGANYSPLTSMIGGLSLVAAVRRVRHPGTKFDHCIVLEGLEGLGKSSAISVLAGKDNFSDQEILTLDERRQQESVQGVWLYEIAELAGMSRADVEKVKAFISRTVDRARPAYARRRVDMPRRCIFFATTNNRDYLLSQTGNRRFWPVACTKIMIDALAKARDQLWAEAAMIEAKGVSLALPEPFWGEADRVQQSRVESDPWDELISEWVETYAQKHSDAVGLVELRITTYDLMTKILKIPEERWSPWHSRRLGFTMRRLNWDGPKLVRMRLLKDSLETVPKRGYSKFVTVSTVTNPPSVTLFSPVIP